MMEVAWDNEDHTVIRFSVEQSWTVDDYVSGIQKANHLMDTVDRTVHLIIDLRESRGIPDGFLSAMRSQQGKIHPNMGFTVIVGAGTLLTSMFRMVTRLYPRKGRSSYMATTIGEAYNILNKSANLSSLST